MDFDEYQRRVLALNICPKKYRLCHAMSGLVAEVGEIFGKFQKLYRDEQGVYTDKFKAAVEKEIGDSLYYISDLCSQLGFKLQSVAESNLSKLEDRQKRNVLSGWGDER